MLDVGQAAEIARRYALGDVPALSGPVARGEQGQVWRLTTSLGRYAVKESFKQLTEEEVREEAEFQEAAHAAGVPTPAVIRTVEQLSVADLAGAQVRVYEWVDLREVDRTLDPEAVGRAVAAIHRLRFPGRRSTDPWYSDAVGSDRWDELVGALRGRGAPFAEGLAGYRDELVALEALLEAPADLQTCHRDLWADNLRSTESGDVCVIDWENCGLADPSQELALILFEFWAGSPDRARTLSDAYVDAGGPGRVDRPGHFSMTIAQLGHIGEMSCTTWLDPDEPEEERERAVLRFAEFAAEALTRGAIEALVESVSA